ncbi:MAG: hypothetical protein AB7G13_11650 [Lautropia sp.]
MTKGAEQALAEARAIVIDSDEMFAIVADELRLLKTSTDALDTQRKSITQPLDAAKAQVMDLFRGPIELRRQAEQIMKSAMAAYTERKEAEARSRRLEAERLARIEQEKAREAAAAAAKAAQEAAEAAAAATTVDERMAAQDQASAAQAAALELEMAAAAPIVAVSAPAAPKASGVSIRYSYGAECTDPMALIRHIAAHPELRNLLEVNQTALRQMANAQREAFNLPGCALRKSPVVSARRAA